MQAEIDKQEAVMDKNSMLDDFLLDQDPDALNDSPSSLKDFKVEN